MNEKIASLSLCESNFNNLLKDYSTGRAITHTHTCTCTSSLGQLTTKFSAHACIIVSSAYVHTYVRYYASIDVIGSTVNDLDCLSVCAWLILVFYSNQFHVQWNSCVTGLVDGLESSSFTFPSSAGTWVCACRLTNNHLKSTRVGSPLY